jgi:glutamyl-tRNA synthetase
MKWGNVTISKKEEIDGRIVLTGKIDLDDKDFKKTKKFTWIANDPATTFEMTVIEYDHLITKKKIEEDEKV